MKAVIVDLNGNDAVALREDGRFEKIKNKSYAIGQEILMQPQVIHFPKQAAIAASAAIVIAACGGMGTYTWSNPISYVSLDINPSITYSLNAFNRVIAANGMNDEGAAIVDMIGASIKNKDITTALTITVEQLSTEAYIDSENTNYMIIGVYSDKDDKASSLMSTVDEFTANTVTVETCSITTVNVSKEIKDSADSYGISAGKMELINEIAHVAVDPQDVDPVVLADLSVAELEQTKTAAASGTSITEAVAAASLDKKEPVAEEIPVDPNAVSSDSKPTDAVDVASASKSAESSEEQAVVPENPSNSNVVTPAAANTPTDSDNTSSPSTAVASNEETDVSAPAAANNSTDKDGHGSSDKKNDKDKDKDKDKSEQSSSSKSETTSSDKKSDSESSDSKEDSSSENKGSASSETKGEVTEDSSQQTNSAPADEEEQENPYDSYTEISLPGDEFLVCSMAV